jgi:hypothetical protein
MMLNASALGAGTLQFLIVALSCVQISEASAYENDQHQYLQRRDIIEHQVHCCARSFVALIHARSAGAGCCVWYCVAGGLLSAVCCLLCGWWVAGV